MGQFSILWVQVEARFKIACAFGELVCSYCLSAVGVQPRTERRLTNVVQVLDIALFYICPLPGTIPCCSAATL